MNLVKSCKKNDMLYCIRTSSYSRASKLIVRGHALNATCDMWTFLCCNNVGLNLASNKETRLRRTSMRLGSLVNEP